MPMENNNHKETKSVAEYVDLLINSTFEQIEWYLDNTDKEELTNAHRAELAVKHTMNLIRLLDQKMQLAGDQASVSQLQQEMINWLFARRQEFDEMETAQIRTVVVEEVPPDA